jgi:hypothetical protein
MLYARLRRNRNANGVGQFSSAQMGPDLRLSMASRRLWPAWRDFRAKMAMAAAKARTAIAKPLMRASSRVVEVAATLTHFQPAPRGWAVGQLRGRLAS